MPLSSGTKLGLYEILSPLGAGGMGEVYRATDSKLGRDVALKVLPAEMAQDPERLARFRREAKALAQLDNPNIVTIHSVEEADGIQFLTMQLVEGQPLDRVIPGSGLPVEQIVEIAGALAEALAAAHEKGIMHRDLKPANVMLTNDGRVKVLDFGLAKETRSTPGDATLTSAQTQAGVVMGTPAYMSPEQIAGRTLDHRTDIFSLGVLLHEMATGRRPFEGASSAELASAILRDSPPPVTEIRDDLPGDLARIIRRSGKGSAAQGSDRGMSATSSAIWRGRRHERLRFAPRPPQRWPRPTPAPHARESKMVSGSRCCPSGQPAAMRSSKLWPTA
jgi:eukaryotic-like serine/threonine-protein kinase